MMLIVCGREHILLSDMVGQALIQCPHCICNFPFENTMKIEICQPMHRGKATPNIKEEKALIMTGNASHKNSAHHTYSEEETGVGIASKGNVRHHSSVPH